MLRRLFFTTLFLSTPALHLAQTKVVGPTQPWPPLGADPVSEYAALCRF